MYVSIKIHNSESSFNTCFNMTPVKDLFFFDPNVSAIYISNLYGANILFFWNSNAFFVISVTVCERHARPYLQNTGYKLHRSAVVMWTGQSKSNIVNNYSSVTQPWKPESYFTHPILNIQCRVLLSIATSLCVSTNSTRDHSTTRTPSEWLLT